MIMTFFFTLVTQVNKQEFLTGLKKRRICAFFFVFVFVFVVLVSFFSPLEGTCVCESFE